MSRSTVFCRLLLRGRNLSTIPRYTAHPFVVSPPSPNPIFATQITRHYCSNFSDLSPNARLAIAEQAFEEISAQAQREGMTEREARIKAGVDVVDLDEEEDYLGVGPLIEKLEKRNAKDKPADLNVHEEPTDSDSESEDEEAINMRANMFYKKFTQFEKLIEKFAKAENFDDAFKWMKRVDEFEEKYLKLSPEYRVIGELMNRLKVAEGKEKFLLQVKLNRALRMAEERDAFDPADPANYGVIEREDGAAADHAEDRDMDDDQEIGGEKIDGFEFDDLKQKDNKFMEKINEIDKKLEEKLEELEYTFGRKGKLLEEEIKELAEERNSLIEQKRQPLYRKGFDSRLVDVNRTCKVTKGGQVVKYSAMVACGNYKGVIGFAKAKAPAVQIAIRKAYEKCFQNLHYVERHKEHTIAHAIQTSYKKTKVYLWPAPTQSGMKAGKTVEIVLLLAGYKNVKSKVVGSRNPHNTVKAVFKALNAIETPKDVQEKFGRTVVESYLL